MTRQITPSIINPPTPPELGDALHAAILNATIHLRYGRLTEAHAAATQTVDLAAAHHDQYSQLCAETLLGAIDLRAGRTAPAVQRLARVVAVLDTIGGHHPALFPARGPYCAALIDAGDTDTAGEHIKRLAQYGTTACVPAAIATAAYLRGGALAATGDLHQALAATTTAVSAFRRARRPYDLATALRVHAMVLRRLRRKAAARAALTEAQTLLTHLGAEAEADTAAAESSRLGLRTGPDPATSQAERQVAEMATNGATNKEIAAALAMSPKTVEAHLTRLYHRHGVRSRTELARLMRRE